MFIKRIGEKNDCVIAGMAVGDLKEKEYDGKTFYEVGVGVAENQIINVAIWNRKPGTIKKYDRVFAAGPLKATAKDGKTYFSLNADFITIEKVANEDDTPKDMTEIDDDSLPF